MPATRSTRSKKNPFSPTSEKSTSRKRANACADASNKSWRPSSVVQIAIAIFMIAGLRAVRSALLTSRDKRAGFPAWRRVRPAAPTFVCEKAPGSEDILKVPADLAVRGDRVQFARPLLNLRGTRVLGSEMGAGAIDPGGTVHLTSTWSIRGIIVRSDYRGTLTQSGGALTGTQTWRGLDGAGHSRTCQVALVLASIANAGNANEGNANQDTMQ